MTRCGVCGAEQSPGAELCWGCGAALDPLPVPDHSQPAPAPGSQPPPAGSQPPTTSIPPGPTSSLPRPRRPLPSPKWLFAVAGVLVGVAAILWVVLQFSRPDDQRSATAPERAATGPGDARSPAEREVLAGPWGVPWGGGEGSFRGAGTDARLDPDALPYRGGDDPLVAIVEFGDYECEFTRKVERTLARLLGRFGGDVRVVFVHNPLAIHDHARLAARAAEAARRQGKFGEMHERLLEANGRVDEAAVVRFAQDLDLDAARFRADLDGWAKDAVAGMTAFAKRHGISGTPHFVIGGRVVEGARPEEVFAKVVEAALEDARGRLAAGKSRRDVYGESVAFLGGG